MATRMLIDARHTEETRVAVLKGNRIEEFDFESAEHKQIKGNIYLAKVTRVEPSLQAAFVDFGGNRHGFLAFSEIHPDYYQIPAEDRAALLAEEEAHAEEEAALRAAEEEEEEDDSGYSDLDDDEDDGIEEIDTAEKDDVATIEDGHVENGDDDQDEDDSDPNADNEDDEDGNDSDADGETASGLSEGGESSNGEGGESRPAARGRRGRRQGRRSGNGRSNGENGDSPNGSRSRAKEMDELRARRQALRRRYKIQDVIQRRQVLLVQVVKEERGNKGAALTTYLSLAGRYCVLMPNSSHGGGISRKISSGADRKRLKQIVAELSLPRSMGLIVRTAGLQRTKAEIKRDFDYLARLWDEIRESTLASSAPAMIHSDSDLIKRAIRDIYNREIEEVVVEGEAGYKAARQFMKLLMPSHMRRVKAYSDPVPLFQRYGAEDQLSAMYDPVVQLKSGGYLVINPTEALVSIDINSGRSTKEHGIEQTALATNLEAAREIARQLRLRDMAGLVVIDFIDMEHNSNVRKVEKAMKDSLKNDRARIQVGRISGFGLMEMSRQRLRTGVLEATTRTCPHCDGTGLVRTASSAGLSALRLIEEEAAKGKGSVISLFASTEAAIYLLNAKRADLAEIEQRYHVTVEVTPEGEDEGAKMRIQSSGPRPAAAPSFEPIADPDDDLDESQYEDEEESADAAAEPRGREQSDDGEDGAPKKRRRRRRGGRGRNRNRETEDGENGVSASDSTGDSANDPDGDSQQDDQEPASEAASAPEARGAETTEETGGESGDETATEVAESATDASDSEPQSESTAPEAGASETAEPAPAPRRRTRRRKPAEATAAPAEETTAESSESNVTPSPEPETASPETSVPANAPDAGESPTDDAASAETPEPAPEKPKRRPRRRKADEAASAEPEAPEAPATPAAEPEAETAEAPKPRRRTRSRAKPAAEAEAAAPSTDDAEPAPAVESPVETPAEALAAPAEPAPAPSASAPEAAAIDAAGPETEDQTETDADNQGDGATARRGWWQRTFGA